MAVKKRTRSSERQPATVQARVPYELEQAVERYADQREVSFSAAVRELLQAGLVSAPGTPTFISADSIRLGVTGGAATYTCSPENEAELEDAIAALELTPDESEAAETVREAFRQHGRINVQVTVEQARRTGLVR